MEEVGGKRESHGDESPGLCVKCMYPVESYHELCRIFDEVEYCSGH